MSTEHWTLVQQLRYDVSGNIVCKSDVRGSHCNSGKNYFYGAEGVPGSLAGPHAVTRVNSTSGNRDFLYDKNGNLMLDRIGASVEREFAYTPFNKLRRVSTHDGALTLATAFFYGPDRARVLKRRYSENPQSTSIEGRTHYIGNVEFEFEGAGFDQRKSRRTIAGVAIEVTDPSQISNTRYQHRDHLGSIVALSTSTGGPQAIEIDARMGFDAWGKRRDPYWVESPWLQWGLSQPGWAWRMLWVTPRGFTGHEHLDRHGVIHMNGRIYDPHLARFLQADPFMEDTGTLNRYTYVHNNPLLYSDPSGYFSLKKWGRIALSIAISVYSGGSASGAAWGLWGSTVTAGQAVTTVLVGGALSGGISSGTWDGAFYGAFSGLAFYNVGQALAGSSWAQGSFAGTDLSAAGLAAKTVSHGLLGGALAHAQGGQFGHGFLSSGVTAASSPYIANGFDGNRFLQGALAATVAGVVLDVITMTGAAGPQGLDGANQLSRLRYQHRDHLGSIVALSKANGELYTRMGFDPWGQRRDPDNAQVPWLQWVAPGALPFDTFTQPIWAQLMLEATPRGYTGHEHLDWHGVIHMNGRIYDPHLARFLQADPFMEDMSTLNRYSYVLNNPLMYTDPSGYFFGSFKDIFKTVISIAISIAAPYFAPGIWGAILAGAASGAIMTGSIEGALWGAFSGAVFFGIGQGFENLAQLSNADFLGTGLSATQFAQQSILHGVAGGTIAHVQGGKFGHGFLSAGVSKAATPGIMDTFNHSVSQGIAVAIVGGTVSEVTGGKFANGAVTAAMAFSFGNALQQERGEPLSEETIEKLAPFFEENEISPFVGEFLEDFDLRDIRVHEGIPWYVVGNPDAYASDLNIYFAPGKFDPNTAAGLALIGHEALHVYQYQEHGSIGMRVKYLSDYLGNRMDGMAPYDAYRAIPFEQDAFRFQAHIEDQLIRRGFP